MKEIAEAVHLESRPTLLHILLALCTIVSMVLASGAGSQWT
jgi:hypothetical protein